MTAGTAYVVSVLTIGTDSSFHLSTYSFECKKYRKSQKEWDLQIDDGYIYEEGKYAILRLYYEDKPSDVKFISKIRKRKVKFYFNDIVDEKLKLVATYRKRGILH